MRLLIPSVPVDPMQLRTRLRYLIPASVASMALMNLAHRVESWNAWALFALVPVLVGLKAGHDFLRVLQSAAIVSVGPSILMLESIIWAAPIGATAIGICNVLQFLLPLYVWNSLNQSRGSFLASAGFVTTWLFVEQVRMLPTLNGIYSSIYSMSYTQSPTTWIWSLLIHDQWLISATILSVNTLIAHFALTLSLRSWLIKAVAITMALTVVNIDSRAPATALPEGHYVLVQTAFNRVEVALWAEPGPARTEQSAVIASLLRPIVNSNSVVFLPETLFMSEFEFEVFNSYLNDVPAVVLTGIAHLTSENPRNAVVGFDNDGLYELYRKWQLVPIIESNIFISGNYASVITLPTGTRLGIVICMDGVNPWLMKQTVLAGATMLYVASATDYGRGYMTPALQLHLTRHQAASLGVPIVFVASNGPTSVVTATGHIATHLEEGEQGIIDFPAPN